MKKTIFQLGGNMKKLFSLVFVIFILYLTAGEETQELYTVDQEKCIGCTICEMKCPVNAITMIDEKAFIDPSLCIKCGICFNVCPMKAISNKLTKEDILNIIVDDTTKIDSVYSDTTDIKKEAEEPSEDI